MTWENGRFREARFDGSAIVALHDEVWYRFEDDEQVHAVPLGKAWPHRGWLTGFGMVYAERANNEAKGVLHFVDCTSGTAKEVFTLDGATLPATAYWLGETVRFDADTVVARCRANKWCAGSEDWLIVIEKRAGTWSVVATIECRWLYGFDVRGDTLVLVGMDGCKTHRRGDGSWPESASEPLRAGSARVAVHGSRAAVMSLVMHIFEDGAKVSDYRTHAEGRYPSYEIAIDDTFVAAGTNANFGRIEGGVLVHARDADGYWREKLKILGKSYGDVDLSEGRLLYPVDYRMQLVELSAAIHDACVEAAPRSFKRDPATIEVLWTSPLEKKRRYFVARTPDGFGVCTKVGRTWKWLEEPDRAGAIAHLPPEYQQAL